MNPEDELRKLSDPSLPLNAKIAAAAKLVELVGRISKALGPFKNELRRLADASPEDVVRLEGDDLARATLTKPKNRTVLAMEKGASPEDLKPLLELKTFQAIWKESKRYEFRPTAKMVIGKLPVATQKRLFEKIREIERVTRISFAYGGAGLTVLGDDEEPEV